MMTNKIEAWLKYIVQIHTIADLVAWLEIEGYDGLASTSCDCGCRLDDLCPCDGLDDENCLPGYIVKKENRSHGCLEDCVFTEKEYICTVDSCPY
jgi:hypothetical protein